MPLGGNLWFPGGGVCGWISSGPRAHLGVHPPSRGRPTRRHPRLGCGASLPSAVPSRSLGPRGCSSALRARPREEAGDSKTRTRARLLPGPPPAPTPKGSEDYPLVRIYPFSVYPGIESCLFEMTRRSEKWTAPFADPLVCRAKSISSENAPVWRVEC
jgi:hypothetical protein